MNRLVAISILVCIPFAVGAQSRPSSLKFFDKIPGLNETQGKASSSQPTADLDRLIQKFGAMDLDQFQSIKDLNLQGSPPENAWTLQRFIEYRSAIRVHSQIGAEGLSRDLKWAKNLGFAYPNGDQLEKIEKSLQNQDWKGRLDFAQNLPEAQRKVYLDAAITSGNDSSAALDILARNLNLFSKERQSDLALQLLTSYSVDRLCDKDLQNIQKLQAAIDYSKKENVCRGANLFLSLAGGDENASLTPKQVAYYKAISPGFNRMQSQKIDCSDYVVGSTLQAKSMALAETAGIVPRGYYENLSSRNELPAAVATNVAQCGKDDDYQSFVHNEILDYPKILKNQKRYFVTNSKAKCSLHMIAEKTSQGYKTQIVLFNSRGEKLFKIDSVFADLMAIQKAALTGVLPAESKANSNSPLPQTTKPARIRSAT